MKYHNPRHLYSFLSVSFDFCKLISRMSPCYCVNIILFFLCWCVYPVGLAVYVFSARCFLLFPLLIERERDAHYKPDGMFHL